MKPWPAVSISAGCVTAISLAVTVLAGLGADRGYDWYSAQCGTAAEVYPELGWLLIVLPLSAGGALLGAVALWLGLKRGPQGPWAPRIFLAIAIILAGCAAAMSALQLLDPCGAGG